MKYIIACFFLLIANSACSLAQEVTTRGNPKYKDIFTPAANTIFSDDFTQLKNGDPAGKKWRQANGLMAGMQALDSSNRNGFGVWKRDVFGVWGTMKPDIPMGMMTGKYVTFECDFLLETDNATLIFDLPDDNGCKHYFSIGKDWWKQHEPCGDTNTIYFRGSFKRSYPVHFDPLQWHCLSISFSDKEMSFYMDGYFFWGLGNNEGREGAYQYMYSGLKPATFCIINGQGWFALRSVRFAQSDTAPKPQMVQIAAFDKILTGEKFVTQDIHFEVNKATIKSESEDYLSALAAWLKQNPTIILEIAGHTDSDGDEGANILLSQQRVAAIVRRLVSLGVVSSRLKEIGYGESKPIKPNDTEAGKTANRRVEFRKL